MGCHRVGDEIPLSQHEAHAIMSHGRAVTGRRHVELRRLPAGRDDPLPDCLAEDAQVGVTRGEVSPGVGNGDQGSFPDTVGAVPCAVQRPLAKHIHQWAGTRGYDSAALAAGHMLDLTVGCL